MGLDANRLAELIAKGVQRARFICGLSGSGLREICG
jgi:hypothetical protein